MDAIEKALELESEKAKRNSAVSGVGIMGKIDHMLGLDAETKMSIGLVKPIELCLVVNGLGGTSNLELGLLANLAKQSLEKRGGNACKITHAMCGSFMTSLNMRGASLTVSVLDENDGALLDEPCEVNAWPRLINLSTTTSVTSATTTTTTNTARKLQEQMDVLPVPPKDATETKNVDKKTSKKKKRPRNQQTKRNDNKRRRRIN